MLGSSFYLIELPSLSHLEEAPVSNTPFFFLPEKYKVALWAGKYSVECF